MRKREIIKLCKYWKHRLRLADWRIRLNIDPRENHDAWGQIVCEHQYKSALITLFVTEPADQVEHTIIHELLHIHHDLSIQELGLAKEKYYITSLEQALNATADALYEEAHRNDDT